MNFVLLSLAVLLQQSAGQLHGVKFATNAKEANVILNKHNDLRRSVNPPAKNMQKMEWNEQAARNSKRWADKCIFKHSPPNERTVNLVGRGQEAIGCGENLFMSTAATPWTKVIQVWYDEDKNFKYGIGATPSNAVIGHYTQLVWANSFALGCASAFCHGWFYIYVCQYCPAGNIQGQIKTPYASGRPCGDCPRACSDRLCTNPCRYVDKFSNCKDLVGKGQQNCNSVPWMKKGCAASCHCPASRMQ